MTPCGQWRSPSSNAVTAMTGRYTPFPVIIIHIGERALRDPAVNDVTALLANAIRPTCPAKWDRFSLPKTQTRLCASMPRVDKCSRFAHLAVESGTTSARQEGREAGASSARCTCMSDLYHGRHDDERSRIHRAHEHDAGLHAADGDDLVLQHSVSPPGILAFIEC